MISPATIQALGKIVGSGHLVTSREALEPFASDATKLVFFPEAVVFPGSTGEVSSILRLATEEKFPVTPRGAGSGMTGGALAVSGGLVMVMSRFNRILSIDEDNLIAVAEPGVVTSDLQKAVETVGLFYPPDPASLKTSTLGGNVAECAGGLRAVKYGVTRDYVLGLTVVLPTGDMLKIGVKTAKGVAGYDLTRLIVGSEGTLAVITSITLRLLPKPEAKMTMTAFFSDVRSAAKVVPEIIRRRTIPTVLEFLDRISIECVQKEMAIEVPKNAGAMLLIEVDGEEAEVIRGAGQVKSVCREAGALTFESATNDQEAERLWSARRNVSPSLAALRPHKISEDIVVPRSLLPDLVDLLGTLSQRYGLPVPAFGHAGDGNIHVNVMLDKNDVVELERAHALVGDLFKAVIQMGGTITGEHGIGITKAQYLPLEISGEGLALMARIKKAFDPQGILNPGKIFVRNDNHLDHLGRSSA
jgi:glycolate dehydrogenase FAD-linked subunit